MGRQRFEEIDQLGAVRSPLTHVLDLLFEAHLAAPFQ
jgi:hypothetical protein